MVYRLKMSNVIIFCASRCKFFDANDVKPIFHSFYRISIRKGLYAKMLIQQSIQLGNQPITSKKKSELVRKKV